MSDVNVLDHTGFEAASMPAINPFLPYVEQRLRDWAWQTGLVTGDRGARRLAAMGLVKLATYVLPTSTRDDLVLMAQWFAFICLVDDGFDLSPAGQRPEAVRALMRRLLAVLTEDHAKPGPECPAGAALTDLWQRTARSAARSWRDRFIANYADFADASHEEACIREARTSLDFTTYLRLRSRTITLLPALDIAERLCGIDLTDEWRDHDLVGRLRLAVVDAIGWVNDIASAEGDLARGQDNLISVIVQEYGCSRSEAIDRASTMVEGQVRSFDRMEAELKALCAEPHVTPPHADEVLLYGSMLRTWLHGVLRWMAETSRFGEAHGRPTGVSREETPGNTTP